MKIIVGFVITLAAVVFAKGIIEIVEAFKATEIVWRHILVGSLKMLYSSLIILFSAFILDVIKFDERR